MNKLILYILLAFMLAGCNLFRQENKKEFSELKIDSSKISKNSIESIKGIQINPPLGWRNLNSLIESKRISLGSVLHKDESFSLNTKSVFIGNSPNQLMTISEMIPDSNSANNFVENYFNFIKLKFRNDEINFDKLIINRHATDKIEIKKEGLMSIRFLTQTSDNRIVQIEFTLPVKDYEKVIENIKSSIATLKVF
ncbi:MAG: hypothetical protein CO129_00950 [Ignavibacteriales bacterium CG_4_9_14_3_um_filter_34_10]|nr:MAG: hypothetical protein CO129_00950 [Ignavibacteriales bacterium CG_4_9_14_3_um_filter_34_10]